VIETHQPDQTPSRIGQRLQAEIRRQQQWEVSPSSPISVRSSSQQAQITHIGLILDAAAQKAQPRHQLPGKLARLPIVRHRKVQGFLLKVYNFLFKEQRTAQMATIQAMRESSKLHQQLLEQTQTLEGFLQDLQSAISPRLETIDYRLLALEQRLALTEQQLNRIQLPEHGIVQLSQLERLGDRLTSVESTIAGLQQDYDVYGERLRYIQAQLAQQRRLIQASPDDRTVAPISDPGALLDRPAPEAIGTAGDADGFYSAFEEEFRGSQAIIRERLKIYLPLIAEQSGAIGAPILDVGCGRGEWLELLQESGYDAIGIDINGAMVVQCQERGLNVQRHDVFEYLQALPDDSLGGISGFHIVEHLPFDRLVSLMAEAFRVVRPGGFVLFETPNPQNVLVGSFSFYLDPTHRNPIPFEVMRFLLRYSGFEPVVPIWANASDIPRLVEDSELAKRFNALFYGFMDYAVMGLKG
jgi:SAM-dependent methyltransferase